MTAKRVTPDNIAPKPAFAGMRLNAWNMSDGTVQIHKLGCVHKAGSGRGTAQVQDQVDAGETAWMSKSEYAFDYWNNGILEEHEAENGAGSFDIFAEMDFKPCTKGLPVGERPVAVPDSTESHAEFAAKVDGARLAKPATKNEDAYVTWVIAQTGQQDTPEIRQAILMGRRLQSDWQSANRAAK